MAIALRYLLLVGSGHWIEIDCRAYAGGEIGVHRAVGVDPREDLWTISHRRTGKGLCFGLQDESTARAVAAVLGRLPIDWAQITENHRGLVEQAMGPRLWHWYYTLQREGLDRDRAAKGVQGANSKKA